MSDCSEDWFNMDEDELVQNLREHVNHQTHKESHEEHIDFCLADNFRMQLSVEAKQDAKNQYRFSTPDLAKALKMDPIEMFLFFMTNHRNLFDDPLAANVSQKRLLLYIQVVSKLCQLELGGFDDQLLNGFARQEVVHEHIKQFAFKTFASPSKGNLDAEDEEMLRNVKFLLIRAHKRGVLQKSGYELIDHFKALIANCQLPQVSKHPLCIEFEQQMKVLPSVVDVKDEIYPTIDYLLGKEQVVSTVKGGSNVTTYIKVQRELLYQDFAVPFREYVQRLHSQDNIEELVKQCLLWPQTKLVLNPEFDTAGRNDLIYVDLLSNQRLNNSSNLRLTKKQLEYVNNIKRGALLCFTTSYDFDNLLLATAVYTSNLTLKQGYINVEIAKQYNIGKIYGINLIMFETPVFFEPYLRVHKYLSTCSVDNFPMKEYIIDGQINVRPPSYISPEIQSMYDEKHSMAANPPIQTKLNHSQLNAISNAFHKEFCLIQGPPGTGKTHLSAELVKILIHNAGNLKPGPIILLTYTNDALDKFLLKVAQHTDSILRIGWKTQIEKYNAHGMADDARIGTPVPPRLKQLWWSTKCEYKLQFDLLHSLYTEFDGSESNYLEIQSALQKLHIVGEKINTLCTIFQFYIARDMAVIAMTTTCAARHNLLFRLLQSKCFIFEEAAEIAEPHILACLTPYTQHVILIGDHKQLRPHIGNHAKELQISLFERLITNKFPASVLNVQYRMRICIADLLVPIFYDNLTSADSVKSYDNLSAMAANLYFVNHTRPEQKVDLSFINKHEAKKLLELILALKQKPSDIVVLSPYNAQVEYINSLLVKEKVNGILVTSVDSYQGLEANIVLLSLVRSNSARQIGFLSQPNRVCVALSRARLALYMIGNMTTLKNGNPELWGVINAKLEAANAIGESFPLASTQ